MLARFHVILTFIESVQDRLLLVDVAEVDDDLVVVVLKKIDPNFA